MKSRLRFSASAGLCLVALLCQRAGAAAGPFDGRWSVVLVCSDTTGKNGPVKGYDYTFFVSITEGAVQGQYGAPGHPASVVYTGQVSDDGTLEILATGNTGQPGYTVGKVARGTNYGYTMQGRLVGASGQAARRELRPCTASFARS